MENFRLGFIVPRFHGLSSIDLLQKTHVLPVELRAVSLSGARLKLQLQGQVIERLKYLTDL